MGACNCVNGSSSSVVFVNKSNHGKYNSQIKLFKVGKWKHFKEFSSFQPTWKFLSFSEHHFFLFHHVPTKVTSETFLKIFGIDSLLVSSSCFQSWIKGFICFDSFFYLRPCHLGIRIRNFLLTGGWEVDNVWLLAHHAPSTPSLPRKTKKTDWSSPILPTSPNYIHAAHYNPYFRRCFRSELQHTSFPCSLSVPHSIHYLEWAVLHLTPERPICTPEEVLFGMWHLSDLSVLHFKLIVARTSLICAKPNVSTISSIFFFSAKKKHVQLE